MSASLALQDGAALGQGAAPGAGDEDTVPMDTVGHSCDDTTEQADPDELADGDVVDGEIDEDALAARAAQDVQPDQDPTFGERIFPGVYGMSIADGICGQVLGFGALFGGGAQHYVAAGAVGIGFEVIMVSFGELALGLRKREHPRRQWLPFLVFSAVGAGVASAMNLLHWWDFDPGHTLAVIFAGVAALGYVGHMFAGFVKGTQQLANLQERRKIRAHELAEEQRMAAQQRRQAAEAEQRRRNNAEQLKRAEEVRKKLPQAAAQGKRIRKSTAIDIGVALGITDKDELIRAITDLRWSPPSSKNTIKSYLSEIHEVLAATR